LHFGSVTLSAESSRAATLAAARTARERGRLVSFDPNVRLELWNDSVSAREWVVKSLALVDLVKVSAGELELLTDSFDPVQGCQRLREHGPSVVVVTLGPRGCYFESARGAGYVEAPCVETVDTLGAGDAFVAGLLSQLCSATSPRARLQDPRMLIAALAFANAVGAITTTRAGAIPALPTRAEVDAFLAAGPP
jgi:fructokinase